MNTTTQVRAAAAHQEARRSFNRASAGYRTAAWAGVPATVAAAEKVLAVAAADLEAAAGDFRAAFE